MDYRSKVLMHVEGATTNRYFRVDGPMEYLVTGKDDVYCDGWADIVYIDAPMEEHGPIYIKLGKVLDACQVRSYTGMNTIMLVLFKCGNVVQLNLSERVATVYAHGSAYAKYEKTNMKNIGRVKM